jgi:hypothetical protein
VGIPPIDSDNGVAIYRFRGSDDRVTFPRFNRLAVERRDDLPAIDGISIAKPPPDAID